MSVAERRRAQESLQDYRLSIRHLIHTAPTMERQTLKIIAASSWRLFKPTSPDRPNLTEMALNIADQSQRQAQFASLTIGVEDTLDVLAQDGVVAHHGLLVSSGISEIKHNITLTDGRTAILNARQTRPAARKESAVGSNEATFVTGWSERHSNPDAPYYLRQSVTNAAAPLLADLLDAHARIPSADARAEVAA